MQIKIELRVRENGEYHALCPQIGFSCQGRSLEEVFDHIKDLLSLYFSSVEDSEVSAEEQAELTEQLSLYLKGKNLFLPRDPKVH